MKHFAPFFILLAALFAAAPMQAAPSQHPPVDTIVVNHFTNANGMAQSPDFSHFFADYLSVELAKGNVAAQVVDQGTPVPDAAAANSLVIEGKFLSHEDAGLMKAGKLIVEIGIYRLSDHALVKTWTATTHFPINADHKDRVYAYYTGTAAADAISDALKSVDLSIIAPAVPGSNPTAPSTAPSPAPAPPSNSAPSSNPAPANPDAVASVQFSSDPAGAEITIDGNYEGNAPSLIKLGPGTHSIKMALPGYAPWMRSIETAAGESRNVAATLEKNNQ